MKIVCVGLFIILLLDDGSLALAQEEGGAMELNPVVVTATRQEEKVLQVPSHVTVITAEDIRRTNATNVGDLLRTESGLWVTNTSGSTPSGIMIDGRGFNDGGGNGSRLLVLIDGRRANLVDTSNPDWAAIPVEAIDRIEIDRGPATSLYGDNAIAGVINIITKSGTREPYTDLSLEHGSYDYWKRKAAISETRGAFGYYLYGGYDTSDGYRDHSDYRASNYVGNLNYNVSNYSTLHLSSGYLSNNYLLPGDLTQDEIEMLGRRASVTPLDQAITHQGRLDLAFDSYLDPNHWIELSTGQTLRGQGSVTTVPNSGSTDLNNDSRSVTFSGKYRITGRVAGGENRFLLGTDLLKEKVHSKAANNYSTFIDDENSDYTRRLIGAYANEELPILSALTLNMTGRMDWSRFSFSQTTTDLISNSTTTSSGNRSFRFFSPMIGLTYLTTPSTSLFATWSRNFRFPNRDELTGFFGLTPELDPEQATTYEAGEKFQAGPAFEGTLSLFHTDVKNEILFVPPAVGPSAFGENENVPEVRHEGIEASGSTRPSPTVRIKGSYTIIRTKIVKGPFEGSHLPITPKHSGSVTVDWGKEKGLIFSAMGRFIGSRYLANDLANQQEKLPEFMVVDAKLGYRFDFGEAFFGVNNLLNRKYSEFGGDGGATLLDPTGPHRIGFYPSPERNYIGGITYRF